MSPPALQTQATGMAGIICVLIGRRLIKTVYHQKDSMFSLAGLTWQSRRMVVAVDDYSNFSKCLRPTETHLLYTPMIRFNSSPPAAA